MSMKTMNGNGSAVAVKKDIMGGVPCVAGTRIPVTSITYLYKAKKISPEHIVTKYYTQLSLDQVIAVLAWTKKNKGYDMAF